MSNLTLEPLNKKVGFDEFVSFLTESPKNNILNSIIKGDCFVEIKNLPSEFYDLIIIDPPYNINKKYNKFEFKKKGDNDYYQYLLPVIKESKRVLKDGGTIYVCCDWTTSPIVNNLLSDYFTLKNRITWKRDKGRGSNSNWKNNLEDIYFATKGNSYYFNPVKIRKKVIAPYKDGNGKNKDWFVGDNGEKYRLTACGNLIDNVTIPFWSMKENTEHPTQKPEKLIAKLILASTREGDNVLDLFSGSGTTSVVCKKLKRNYTAIEKDSKYFKIIKSRLSKECETIQGYNKENYFYERNACI